MSNHTINSDIVDTILLYVRNASLNMDFEDDEESLNQIYEARKKAILLNSTINLSYEGLTYIPTELIGNFANSVRIMDLSHNNLSSLEFLEGFTKLTSLILDNNILLDPTTMPILKNVTLLWLNNCNIDLLKLHAWIFQIQKCCPHIKYLSIICNPGTASLVPDHHIEYINYRNFVTKSLPTLLYLDASRVKPFRVIKDVKAVPTRSYLNLNTIISDIASFFQRITSRKPANKYLFINSTRTKIFGDIIDNSLIYDENFTKNK